MLKMAKKGASQRLPRAKGLWLPGYNVMQTITTPYCRQEYFSDDYIGVCPAYVLMVKII
jgi:hypothetical protein